MTYRGYFAVVEFDAEGDIFWGKLGGINDIVSFEADNVAALKAAFHEAVEDYIVHCAQSGKSPEKPHSGKVMFRIAPDLHAKAARAAEISGKSLNQWAEEKLRAAVEKECV
jgi:predicted HicB family RNase H-like nuclease